MKSNLLAIAVALTAAGVNCKHFNAALNIQPAKQKEPNPETEAKAQAKRDRKAARRLKCAQ